MKAILAMKRTEEGKEIRRQMKDKGIGFRQGRCLYPRTDGLCNTLTGVQKDNLLIEIGTLRRIVLGWSRGEKGRVTNMHPVDVANCVTANKRDNTQNYVLEQR